jgi:beta-glucosidase
LSSSVSKAINDYPGDNFDYHLIPFKAAIAAGARQIMPYYSRPIGTEYLPVAFAFNKPIITGLLQEELGFEGIVLSDWYLITNHVLSGEAISDRATTGEVLGHGRDGVRPDLLALEGFNVCNE